MKQVVNYWDRLTDSYAIPYDYVVTKRFESNRVLLYNHTNQKEYQCVNFCSNDMHGFSRHPTVIHSAVKAIKDFGTSSSGSYGTSGRNQIHKDLVAVISQHKNLPFSQLFINAWAASASFFYAMCVHGPSLPGFRESANIVIIRDQLNHASLSVASDNVASLIKKRMSPSTRIKNVIYSHNNVEDARLKLKKFTKPGDRIILVSDGVFSMDGDIAPIPGLLDVLSEYPDSTLYIDEAHSTGSLGKHGGGVLDYYGIDAPNGVFNAVNIVLLTTFSKYAASAGAAISSGCSELVHLMNFSPTSLLTIAIPPAQAASALASTKLLQEEPAYIERLNVNANYIRTGLKQAGFEVRGESVVIPVILPKHFDPKVYTEKLLSDYGVWVTPVWNISTPRMRIVSNSTYSREDMDYLCQAMQSVAEELDVDKVPMHV